MTDDKPKKSPLLGRDYMFCGALSGFSTRLLCQPFDVVKIRFQLQVEPISKAHSGSTYHSVLQAARLIVKEEGFTALWKGHVPAQALSITYGLLQFYCYETFSRSASDTQLGKSWKPAADFVSGAGAGGVATLASFPFDVLRTRIIAQREGHRVYSGLLTAIPTITRTEGFHALYRGLLPTFIQILPHAGIQFMAYKTFMSLCVDLLGGSSQKSTLVSSALVAGSLAGACAKTAIYPFDLIRKRMQIQGFHYVTEKGEKFACKGMLDAVAKTFQREGLRGLFKGLTPSLLKAVTSSALHFGFYEFYRDLMVAYRS